MYANKEGAPLPREGIAKGFSPFSLREKGLIRHPPGGVVGRMADRSGLAPYTTPPGHGIAQFLKLLLAENVLGDSQ